MSVGRDWRRAMAIARKDLTTELRAKAGFNGVASLAVTILILLGLALGPDAEALRNAGVGAVWLATLFSGVLAFNRSFQVELESGALEPLLLYPGPRWPIFAGKLLGNLIFVSMMVGIVMTAGIVLFGIGIPSQFLSMLPYAATVVVLVIISHNRRTTLINTPASLGKAFVPER